MRHWPPHITDRTAAVIQAAADRAAEGQAACAAEGLAYRPLRTTDITNGRGGQLTATADRLRSLGWRQKGNRRVEGVQAQWWWPPNWSDHATAAVGVWLAESPHRGAAPTKVLTVRKALTGRWPLTNTDITEALERLGWQHNGVGLRYHSAGHWLPPTGAGSATNI